MTYIYHILRDNPIAVYSLDSNGTDASGYNRDGTPTGSPALDRPVVAKGIGSLYFDATGYTFPVADVMIQNKDSASFTLEAWVRIHNSTGTATILGRNGSGLFVESGVLKFKYQSAEIDYSWLEIGRTAHIVAVYDTNQIYLYVNSELVGQTDFIDAMAANASSLTTTTTGGSKMTVDSIAVYNYPLNLSTIISHYALGTDYPNVYDISRTNGGNVYVITSDNASLKLDVNDLTGNMTNVAVIDDELVNLVDDTGSYAAGTWEKSISLTDDTVDPTGSSISWVASSGITFSISIDGGSYTTITNGSQPFSTLDMSTDHTISVKADFPAGVTQSSIKSFRFIVYYSKAIQGSDSSVAMTVTNPDNVTLDTVGYHPAEFSDNVGALITSTGAIAIPVDANFGGYVAVEFTVLQTANIISGTIFTMGGTTPPKITTNSSGQWVPGALTALIVDGVVVSSATTIALNKWHHVIAIFATRSDVVNIATGLRLGYLAVYPSTISELTTVGAQNVYKNWVGAAAIQYVDSDSVTIQEHTYSDSGGPARGYTYDWQITPAG